MKTHRSYAPSQSRQAMNTLVFLAMLAQLVPSLAFAQSSRTDPADLNNSVHTLDKFEVTGSYIPVAGTTTAIPVTTLSAEAIAETGVTTNVLEVLRKATPQFMGNGNLGNSNGNIGSGATGGGSALAFRNTQTLVLLNGRRSAYAPIVSSGGFQFVDVNMIPISAIEKIEILQDGASAIYGTDAVAGVVNIKLKSDYQGMETGFNYGFSDNDGNYAVRKGWVVGGSSSDKTRVTFAGEWTKSDPLFQYERQFSNPAFGTASFAGVINIGSAYYVLNPNLNAPPTNQDLPIADLVANGTYIAVNSSNLISGAGAEAQYSFNLAQYVTLLIGNERQSSMLNFEHQWNDSVTVFGDLLYSKTKTYSQLNAQPTTASLAADHPHNPTNERITARNRFVDRPRQYFYDTINLRATLGARGAFNQNWNWEAAALLNTIEQNYRNEGVIDTAARVAAVAAGLVNYTARQQAAGAVDAAGMFGTAMGHAVSELSTYDARISGKLYDLPAGELGFAAGVDWRTEKLAQTADRGSQAATFSWDSATTLDPFSADRDVNSFFANVRVPILGKSGGKSGLLEFEAAIRYEKYSDTDDPTVPKYMIRYLPFDDQFALRTTYSESFAAPTLFQLFGPGGIGFTSSLSLDRFGGGPEISGQANSRSGSNSALLPATSKNYTLGVVWSPKAIKGFSVSVDYFSVKQKDLISAIGSSTILQDVELNGAASPYAQFVRISSAGDTSGFAAGAPITAPGQIGNNPIDDIYVTDTLVNIAKQNLAGLDVKVDYTWTSDSLGRFNANLAGIWWDHFRAQTLPGTDEFDTIGQATGFNGTIPTFQTYTNISWQRKNWSASLGWQFIPSVDDVSFYDAQDSTADEHVEAFHSIDFAVSYGFGSRWKLLNGLTVKLGATNLFNESAPAAKGTFTESNADIATYGAVGRFIYMEAILRF